MNTMTRREFGGLAAAATAAAALVGCSGGGGGSGGKNGDLSLYNDNVAWKSGFVQAGNALKKLTGHGFQPLAVPQQDAYAQLVKSSITTHKAADVVKWHEGYPLQELARTGHMTDLSDVWATIESKGWVDPTLKPSYTYQGKIYGVPLAQSYWVVFYNKALFAKAKVSPPTSYDEFLKVAAALKSAGTTPMWTGVGDGWESFVPFVQLLVAQDPNFYVALTNNKASYTDPVASKALALWKVWIDNKWVTPVDSKLDDAAGLMKSGKLAMLLVGTWNNSALKKAGLVPGKDYGAFLFPTINGAKPAVFVEGSALMVPSNAPDHAASVKQVSNWLDPSVQHGWSDFLGDNSANPKVGPTDPALHQADQAVSAAHAMKLTRYFEASPPNLINGNIQDLSKFMLDPSKAASVLASMQARAKTEWASWNNGG